MIYLYTSFLTFTAKMVCYFFLDGVEKQIWRERDDTLGR